MDTNTYELRDYQAKARDAVLEAYRSGTRSTLLVMPTATGKTVVFSHVVKDFVNNGQKVLVIAKAKELLEQAERTLAAMGVTSAWEKGRNHVIDGGAPVALATNATMHKDARLALYPKDHFGLIVVDEAHHSEAASYKKILGHFGKANVLGATATPDRTDGKKLSVFETVASQYTLAQAIDDGNLSNVVADMIPLRPDLSKVKIAQGDFEARGVGNALEPYLDRIADIMKDKCAGRKTVVFLPLVEMAKKFRDILTARGMKAIEVDGSMPAGERDRAIRDFASGKYDVICNAMLLTEGWDCPEVDCIAVLRPTRSRSLYAQMVGRGLRPAPGKTDLLLLDFLWLSERHSLATPASLLGEDEELTEQAEKYLEASAGEKVPLLSDKFRRETEKTIVDIIKSNEWREPVKADPVRESIAKKAMSYRPFPFESHARPATPKQLEVLSRKDYPCRQGLTVEQASWLITNASTRKQIELLAKYGFAQAAYYTKQEASALISSISNNRWRVPKALSPATYKPGDILR